VSASTDAVILQRQFARRMEAVDTRWSGRQANRRKQLQHTNELWDDIQASEERQPRYSSPWFYWPFMVALADERQFMGQLAQTLAPAVQGSASADHSAIMSTITQWTQAPPGGQPFDHVYIFSDMLENSQAVPWSEFRSMESDAAMAAAERFGYLPAVQGADVQIVGFGRSQLDPGPDARLRGFWTDDFRAGGASVTFEGAIRN